VGLHSITVDPKTHNAYLFPPERGERVYRETIAAVQAMTIDERDRQKIFEGNARRLFRLPDAP